MNTPEIIEFIKSRRVLFWSVGENSLENISKELLVEQILNFGNLDDIRKLFELLGLENVSEIFYKQTSPQRKRINYNKRTLNFFTLFFNKYVKKISDVTTTNDSPVVKSYLSNKGMFFEHD